MCSKSMLLIEPGGKVWVTDTNLGWDRMVRKEKKKGDNQLGWERCTHKSETRINVRIAQFKLAANQEWVKGRGHDALWMRPCTDRGADDSAKYMTQVLGTLTLTLHRDSGRVPAFLWVVSDLWVSRLNSHHAQCSYVYRCWLHMSQCFTHICKCLVCLKRCQNISFYYKV